MYIDYTFMYIFIYISTSNGFFLTILAQFPAGRSASKCPEKTSEALSENSQALSGHKWLSG